MNGEAIVRNVADIAKRQYDGESELAAARFEIDLLRTKVLEFAKKVAELQFVQENAA